MTEQTDEAQQVRYSLLQRTILEVLDERGQMKKREVVAEVARRVEFTPFELTTHAGGQTRYEAAISWGSVDMKVAGWIEKEPAGWSITEAGRQVLGSTGSDDDIARLSATAYRQVHAQKRLEKGRFKTARYPLIDQAVKLVPEGRWITYKDIGTVVGSNGSSVGEYVHGMDLEGHHRVVPVGLPPYRDEWRTALEEEGVEFDQRGLPDPMRNFSAEDLREQMDLLGLLPTVARRAWFVRGSQINGTDLVPDWVNGDGWISLAASSLRSVQSGIGRDELRAIVDEDYAHVSYAARMEKLDAFHIFLTRMRIGDLVVTADQGQVFVGTLRGEAGHRRSEDSDSNLVRPTTWFDHEGLPLTAVPEDLAAMLKVQRDVVDLTAQLGAIESLLDIGTAAADSVHDRGSADIALQPAGDELARSLHVPLPWLQECIDLLADRPQLVFYGPPGTGKTFIARALGRHLAGDNVRLVQFHPAYSYEDFFEGYRPTSSGGFELKPGPMRKIVDHARENPRDVHVLIIDEMNRGNLAKVFGELYFLLEYRNENVELLYGEGDFTLPRNVIIIGTMNTADRSIALVDAAMRRRFAFLPLHPSEVPTSGVLRLWLESNGLPSHAADLLDELNARIADPDFKIGPSYLMRSAVHADRGLERAWRTAILPLLEEHHYGELDQRQVAAKYGLDAVTAAVLARRGEADTDATSGSE